MESASPIISIQDLHKTFGKNKILKGVNIDVNKGETLVILGRSGTGKSVTIKCLVRLVEADQGVIAVFGADITQVDKAQLNDMRSKIGFMFQNGALYDSMSVRENLRFTLKHHNKILTDEEVETKIKTALEDVGLADAIDKMPSELSGGMQKRIAMARTFITGPEIILYDEPTSGLDTITAREISELIQSIQKKQQATSIIITHDMACAKINGNRIIILNEGKVHAEGSYDELENSEDDWVRSFFNY